MQPVVCLDRGFSSQFDGEFGWFARGKEYRVDRSDEIADGLVYLQDQASQGPGSYSLCITKRDFISWNYLNMFGKSNKRPATAAR